MEIRLSVIANTPSQNAQAYNHADTSPPLKRTRNKQFVRSGSSQDNDVKHIAPDNNLMSRLTPTKVPTNKPILITIQHSQIVGATKNQVEAITIQRSLTNQRPLLLFGTKVLKS